MQFPANGTQSSKMSWNFYHRQTNKTPNKTLLRCEFWAPSFLPLKQASDLVTYSNHHNLFPCIWEVGNLILQGFSNGCMDSTTQASVRGHTNKKVLLLVLRCLYFCLLIESWKKKRLLIFSRVQKKQVSHKKYSELFKLKPIPKGLQTSARLILSPSRLFQVCTWSDQMWARNNSKPDTALIRCHSVKLTVQILSEIDYWKVKKPQHFITTVKTSSAPT